MEYMKTIPDKFFNLAIVDPPYGINADKFNNGAGLQDHAESSTAKKIREKGRLNQGSGKLKNRLLNTSDCSWDSSPPPQEYFQELFRTCENLIIWGGNYFDLPPTRCVVVWDKQQPWENFSQVEIAWTTFDYPAKIFRYCNAGGANGNINKIHPCQKPVALYDFLIKTFAKAGDKIFDSHMGSQSSRIAAYKANLDYYGCELNEFYYKLGEERFSKFSAQMNLFVD